MTGQTAQLKKSVVISRERISLIAATAILVGLAWGYLLKVASDMPDMSGMTVAMPWTAVDVFMLFVMWVIMMIAMMLPSATPMILTFQMVNSRRPQHRTVPTYLFMAGYLVIWALYSLAATLLQWLLHSQALISAAMAVNYPLLSGSILICAGLFQWSQLKGLCLTKCRSPLAFLMAHWREGHMGAFKMGLQHGSYCAGCCWLLMLVLFVTGVMNLLAVLLIAIFVLAEKTISNGIVFAKIGGAFLIIAGVWQLNSY